MNVVLPMFMLISLPVAIAMVFAGPIAFSPTVRAATIVVWLSSIFLSLCRRLNRRVRAWGVFLPLYGMSVLSLHLVGLAGSARLLLLAFPVMITLLVGVPSGIVATILSLVIFGAMTLFFSGVGSADHLAVRENPSNAAFWTLEAFFLAAVLLALVVLLIRFLRFQTAILAEERESAGRLQEEILARRELEMALMQVSERERRQTGRELHDGVCQHILGAQLELKVMEKGMGRTDERLRHHMESVRDLLGTALKEAHDLSLGLAPGALSIDSLVPALEDLARRVRENHEIDCQCRISPIGQTSLPDAAAHLFRIAQESVSNALHHAGAGIIQMELSQDAEELRLTVEDDGRGLSPGNSSHGMGMKIMAARAAALGGVLEAGPRPGGGTRICCRVPSPCWNGKQAS